MPFTIASQFAHTIQSVHAATRKTLLKVKGFSEVKVDKIKEAISKLQVRSFSCSNLVMPQHSGSEHADHLSRDSLQHQALSLPLSSIITGREYARSRPEASSWILFLEGESTRATHSSPSG